MHDVVVVVVVVVVVAVFKLTLTSFPPKTLETSDLPRPWSQK